MGYLDSAFDLSGTVAVVTGGGSGMGRASSEVLAEAGASVVVGDIDTSRADETVAAITAAGGTAKARRVDVSQKASVDALVDFAVAEFGRLDAMCNVAGVPHSAEVVDVTEEDLDRLIAINLKGTFFGCQAAMRVMVPQGSGSIVNVASSIIDLPFQGYSVYGMTKAAVTMLSRVLAAEGGPHGIRVNTLAPGSTDSAFIDRHRFNEAGEPDPERLERYLAAMRATSPLGLMGEPIDQAYLILYLVSPASRFATGNTFRANGGNARPW
ncbi:SDR family oxidoreductase [Phytohabitans sp. ZYX-F-186]|uniref:SDR family oxidoreductase n=1 Tax=Phytohabitans maris TaxID=3071409 RepID=A0ABU0Z9K1_9ACTN|nr:SDR family oxidoreductase [Phytohabitans sp. ZYX-F-186]MDQ7903723.1 SDR family oxidoreductase [Phytohabitans sp. ZYX-F-186]